MCMWRNATVPMESDLHLTLSIYLRPFYLFKTCQLSFVISSDFHLSFTRLQLSNESSYRVPWKLCFTALWILAWLCSTEPWVLVWFWLSALFPILNVSSSINYFHQKSSTHTCPPTHQHPRAHKPTLGMRFGTSTTVGKERRDLTCKRSNCSIPCICTKK